MSKNKSPKILIIDIQQDFLGIPPMVMEKIHIENLLNFPNDL